MRTPSHPRLGAAWAQAALGQLLAGYHIATARVYTSKVGTIGIRGDTAPAAALTEADLARIAAQLERLSRRAPAYQTVPADWPTLMADVDALLAEVHRLRRETRRLRRSVLPLQMHDREACPCDRQ